MPRATKKMAKGVGGTNVRFVGKLDKHSISIKGDGGSGGNREGSGGQGGGASNTPFDGGFSIHHVPIKVPKLNIKKVTKSMPESPRRTELQKEYRAYYVTKKYTEYEYQCNYTIGHRAHCKEHSDAYVKLRDASMSLLSEKVTLEKARFPLLLTGMVYGALLTVIIHFIYVSQI